MPRHQRSHTRRPKAKRDRKPEKRLPSGERPERPIREDLVRAAALEALGATLGERQLADRVLERVLRRESRLYSNERRAVAERTYAVLRRKATFDFAIERALGPEAARLTSVERDTLRLALARLAEGELAAKVVADAGVRFDQRRVLDTWAKLDAELAPLNPMQRLSVEGSLPEFLARRLLLELDLDDSLALARVLNVRGPLTVRANLLKTDRAKLAEALQKEGVASKPTRYSPWGLELEGRQNAFALAAFKRGEFEIQDEGSQLLALLLGAKPRERIVDACAGAGGKTLALAACMQNQGEIWALDVDEPRLEEARLRARRAGVSIVRSRAIPAEAAPAEAALAELVGQADRVLVDAPCSGVGALRRNPDARWRLQEPELARFHKLQVELLGRFAKLAKPGGLVVYATCSVLREENEDVVKEFLASGPGFDPVPVRELLTGQRSDPVGQVGDLQPGELLRLWPHRHGTDGFFAAAFRRRG